LHPHLGATYLGNDTCGFCVRAPFARSVAVRIVGPAGLVVGGGPAVSTSAGPDANANASASANANASASASASASARASASASASASPSHSPSVGPAADPRPRCERRAARAPGPGREGLPSRGDERCVTREPVLLPAGREGGPPGPRLAPSAPRRPRPSRVVDPGAFSWSDANWLAPPQEELVIHELHMGIFRPEGTFEAVVLHLDDLRDLGMKAVEPMPVV